MIIVFKQHTKESDIEDVCKKIEKLGYEPRIIKGVERTVIGAVGDEQMHKSLEAFKAFDCVEDVLPIQKRYKIASREYHKESSIVKIGDRRLGNGHFQVIAGPCAIESYEQLKTTAEAVIKAGAGIIRGGAYKPRTSPYDFQGLGEEGLELLQRIKDEYNVPVVTEVVGVTHIDKVAKVADCLQIGARNSQNYHLLEAVAGAGRPVLLKRGMSSTIEEWLSAAEYLIVNGCHDVILCERGIRTFEHATRNTLDLSAVAIAKRETHLPVIVDPSHAAGRYDLVLPLSKAAIAIGADGLIVEVHCDPVNAVSDAAQQIPSGEFGRFMKELEPIMKAVNVAIE
ncbi:MAG: 3-deoxy-7-phosphoheptulonate synthase [Lentisphaerae bacterium GWF2_45_14]|nr:MAG: 3-deoxy-7-phosphoheptulonate synthase [Lentisphaerae bacterium GWF2_45_14]